MTDERFDEQLDAELNRRAASANLSRDWARRVLLPAVTARIDSRPQPVVTSRWSAVAGLASVAAILLVLVVALPRMSPGPAATASPGTQPSPVAAREFRVFSTSEFAMALGGGDLANQTVVVEGELARDVGQEARCRPLAECYIGPLRGADRVIDVFADWVAAPVGHGRPPDTELPEDTWSSWLIPADSGDLLLLRVDENGHVEYLGYPTLSSTGMGWTVADLVGVQPSRRSVSQVHIVEAFLVDNDVDRDTLCADVLGLQPRECPQHPTDALAGARFDPESGAVPALRGSLAVQGSASEDFGSRAASTYGLFAIAPRLYGGCEVSPCWHWDVVGRISDEPVVEPSTRPVVANTMTCGPAIDPAGSPIERARPIVIDETGLVESCESIGPAGGPDGGILVTNPDGDETVLQVHWSGNPCELASTFKFSLMGTGYSLQGRRPDVGCIEPLWYHAMRIKLRQPVPAESVTADMQPPGGPFATPAPTDPVPTPQIAPEPMACSEEEVHATVFDETGHVESCATVRPTDGGDPTILANPRGDLRVLRITWGTSRCDMDASFRLMLTRGGFVLEERPGTWPHLDDGTPVCVAVAERHAIELQLAGEIDVRHLTYRFVPTDPAPTPESGSAWWELAPTERPTATTTQLDLQVFEEACSGGESPEGRVFGPIVKYSDLAVTITFQITPLAGAGDCATAPGAEVTIFLSEPLGDRRLVDGGFASGDRVIEHGDGLLWVSPSNSEQSARARLDALLGSAACPEPMSAPRAVDEAALVEMANDLGSFTGMLGDGLAYVGDVGSVEALRELGGFELFSDRDRSWYLIGFAEQQEWLAEGVEPGDLVMADVTTLPISAGRTIWMAGRYHQTFGSPDCEWESDTTTSAGPRADEQGFDFTLSISAPSASWTRGQSLEGFGAILEYSGALDPIHLVGPGSSGVAIAFWSRLDGDPAQPTLAVTGDCRTYPFAAGERRQIGMWPAPGFADNGQLALPPGIWRLTARTGATIGECGGQPLDLSTSIIVRVR